MQHHLPCYIDCVLTIEGTPKWNSLSYSAQKNEQYASPRIFWIFSWPITPYLVRMNLGNSTHWNILASIQHWQRVFVQIFQSVQQYTWKIYPRRHIHTGTSSDDCVSEAYSVNSIQINWLAFWGIRWQLSEVYKLFLFQVFNQSLTASRINNHEYFDNPICMKYAKKSERCMLFIFLSWIKWAILFLCTLNS